MTSKARDQFEEKLAKSNLQGLYTESQFRALYMLTNRMPNVMEDRGFTYDGFSWRPGIPLGILCVKVWYGDEPLVCFIRERDMVSATVILARMLAENRVAWKPDKFR